MTLQRAILSAFAAFGVFACGDALIKSAGAGASTFTIAFFVTLFAMVPIAFARPRNESWLSMFRMRHPGLTLLRSAAGVGAGLAGFYAFAHLPLSETYTLIFLMPFFVTVLSVLFLKEQVGWRRWTALAIGMAGVLLVIKPGFREVVPAHAAALVAGMCGAVNLVVLRQIGNSEKRTSLLGVPMVVALAFNGALIAPIFTMPAAGDLAAMAGAGLLHGAGALLLIAATQVIQANRIAPIQYSQLIWGVGLGYIFFAEKPDAIAGIGLILIALSGLATFLREDRRGVWPRDFRDLRNRF
jgi:S-adenosylmethionine uptake transporter